MPERLRWLLSLFSRRRPDDDGIADARVQQHDRLIDEIEHDQRDIEARLRLLERQARRHGRGTR
jgi:hypothetical protein